jgi:hypothetical protein
VRLWTIIVLNHRVSELHSDQSEQNFSNGEKDCAICQIPAVRKEEGASRGIRRQRGGEKVQQSMEKATVKRKNQIRLCTCAPVDNNRAKPPCK